MRAAIVLVLASALGIAHGQVRDYPTRTIRILVPSAHSGAGDARRSG